MTFFVILVVVCGLVVIYRYVERYFAGASPRRWFVHWTIRGFVAPFLLWLLVNLNIGPWPALMPDVAAAKIGSPAWFDAFVDAANAGLIVINTFWGALTYAWLMSAGLAEMEDRKSFLFRCVVLGAIALPIAALILYLWEWYGLGAAVMCLLGPAAHGQLPERELAVPQPAYSRAVAKIKFGKFDEAEWEVLTELERFQNDFEGWMMLATLYAEHFKELDEADRTIRDVCGQPDITPVQISVALNRLADWHLKFGTDPSPARDALEELCRRIPQGHLAVMARQRLQRMPTTAAELIAGRQVKKLRLPSSVRDLNDAAPAALADSGNAQAEAQHCVEALIENPNDIPAREKLATLQAERLGQVDRGLEQLQLLLEIPGQPDAKMADWLGLIASWQIRYLRDTEAAQVTLLRIVREFPQTPGGFVAQRRLSLMVMESKMRQWRAGRSA